MEAVMKLQQKTRGNVVRFIVVPEENSHDLSVSGMPHYGQAELVIKDEDFNDLKEGKTYSVTFEEMAEEAETAETDK